MKQYLLVCIILITATCTQAQQPPHKYKVGDTAFCGIVFYERMDSLCIWTTIYMRNFSAKMDTIKTSDPLASFISRRDSLFFVDTVLCGQKVVKPDTLLKEIYYRDSNVTIFAFYNLYYQYQSGFMYGQHGLVCSMADIGLSVPWDTGYLATNASTDILFDRLNAERITTKLGNGYTYAASVARNFIPADSACKNWYLPSKSELGLIYNNLASKGIGGFAKEGYWSSVEMADSAVSRVRSATQRKVWLVDFFDGKTFTVDKVNKYHVRAVREFWVRN